jgi:cell division septation protein DedD
MDINKSIRELLLRHSCVVIPGFGGFVASIAEAQLDLKKGIITPPRKAILFNKNLINNDGLLVHHLAAANHLTYTEASDQLVEIVEKWNKELHIGHRIVIEQVGTFYFNHEQNIQFEQDRFFNLLLSSFGLTNVNFVPEASIVQEEKIISPIVEKKAVSIPTTVAIEFEKPLETKVISIVKEEAKEDPKIIVHPVSKNLTKKLVKYVAAACLLPIAFYSVWIPVKTDVLESGIIFSSDFNPFNKSEKAVYQAYPLQVKFERIPEDKSIDEQIAELPAEVNTFSYEFAEDVYIPVKLNRKKDEVIVEPIEEITVELPEVVEVKTPEKVTKPMLEKVKTTKLVAKASTLPVSTNSNHAKFKLVVGSFASEENASVLVNELKDKGFDAFSINEGAKVRVCATSTNSSNEATNLLDTLAKMKYDAWVLSK